MLFSEKLRLLRKENALTQEDLSEKLNVSRQAITKWESGEGMPDIDNLKQISVLFNVSIDELVKEDKNVTIKNKGQFSYTQKLEIDHIKHFDIHICDGYSLNIWRACDESVKVELSSNEEEKLNELYEVKFDNLYNKLDIDIETKKHVRDAIVDLYLPEKYINDIELNAKMKILNVVDIDFKKIEYDGKLKYLNVKNSVGAIVLNTTKCDVEVDYDKLDGSLEINTFNSVTRVSLPKEANYKTILKGRKNEFIDAINTENSKNLIELNGINSKLFVIQK